MKNSFDEKILVQAAKWVDKNENVILATVINTWGSSARPIGSKMIINENGDFSGSVSGGCVESSVVAESLNLIKEKKSFKKIEFKVSDKNAWDVGLACGGTVEIFLEKII
jgi:xanthine/CO dehydrogenase XdhC/CoxF family maturation factor